MISLPLEGTSNFDGEAISPIRGLTIVEASLLPRPCLLRGNSALKSFDDDDGDPLSFFPPNPTPSLHLTRGSVAHNTFTCKNPKFHFLRVSIHKKYK